MNNADFDQVFQDVIMDEVFFCGGCAILVRREDFVYG